MEEKRIYKEKFNEIKERINILIITATNFEKDAIIKELEPIDSENEILLYHCDGYEYVVGKFGKYNIVHVKTDEGNLGTYSSQMTTYKALSIWTNIKIVIAIGIACGNNDTFFEIGDILLSEKVFYYEKCKIIDENEKIEFKEVSEENEIFENDKLPGIGYDKIIGKYLLESSRELLQIFEKKDGWSYKLPKNSKQNENVSENEESKRQVQIGKGTLFSGEKIIGSSYAKEKILKLSSGSVIGFEMEGAGIAYACESFNQKNWILVKGISDFGNKDKISDKGRKKAIASVVSYCKYIFDQEDAFESILQKRETLLLTKVNNKRKIGDFPKLETIHNYIYRKVIPEDKANFWNYENKITLYKAITEEHKRIVLLSDAGMGKTLESKNLVNEINETLGSKGEMFAFYKNLNTYSDKKIVEMIPDVFKDIEISKIIFVLDRL